MATSLSLSQFLSSLLPSKQPIPPPPPPSSLHFPNKPPSGWVSLVSTTLDPTTPSCSSFINPIVCPALAYSNTLYFKSCYNVQVIVGENEPEDKLVGRFRREVLRAGVIQECKRRRYFENTHDKKKRKARDAARRNRKWFGFLSSFCLFLFSFSFFHKQIYLLSVGLVGSRENGKKRNGKKYSSFGFYVSSTK